MARFTSTLPYALFTALLLLFLSSSATAKKNGTIITNGTAITNGSYTKPHSTKPHTYQSTVPVVTATAEPKTEAETTAAATNTGTQPSETQVITGGAQLSFIGTGTAESLFGVLIIGFIAGLGLELGL
ncbi:hypothetical protein ONS95_002291 [Cadophora gregata]|uniref:uncharacterized protein n=1 Tax=Cadophora gregata TaxID=51156 RepID=UPI0026DBD9C0|nr:uncharacterized protein ONS95_002291 [Cadophora gregata]KAK0109609.1 hypothetical protein ONS95_002291 [Cadophora gregata]KAK0110761.1 hypothetical protein ONS96_002359 [Cadophora gregata f. sp. sojae]